MNEHLLADSALSGVGQGACPINFAVSENVQLGIARASQIAFATAAADAV